MLLLSRLHFSQLYSLNSLVCSPLHRFAQKIKEKRERAKRNVRKMGLFSGSLSYNHAKTSEWLNAWCSSIYLFFFFFVCFLFQQNFVLEIKKKSCRLFLSHTIVASKREMNHSQADNTLTLSFFVLCSVHVTT